MKARAVVVGLDGGSWGVLDGFVRAGHMPNLERLIERGRRSTLRSTTPPITPVAWASFATGMEPGGHGVFGFGSQRAAPGSYMPPPARRDTIAAPTLWRRLTEEGMVSIVLNVPLTYPPEPIRGSLVTGMFTPGLQSDCTYPPELKGVLSERDSMPRFNTRAAAGLRAALEAGSHDAIRRAKLDYLSDLDDMTEHLVRALRYLGSGEFDLMAAVFVATDRVQHWMWDEVLAAATGECDEIGTRICELYRNVDKGIGVATELAGEDGAIFLMSDHGFGSCAGQFAVNAVLVDRGYAAARRQRLLPKVKRMLRRAAVPNRLRRKVSLSKIGQRAVGAMDALDWARTSAYFVPGTNGVRINVRGREVNGIIKPGAEYERLRIELRDILTEAADPETGARPIERVQLREHVYDGELVQWAPDLILLPGEERGYVLAAGDPGADGPITHPPHSRGSHRQSGIFLAHGPGIGEGVANAEVAICDVAPTIMKWLGVPVRDHMDGVPLDAVASPVRVGRSAEPHTFPGAAAGRSGEAAGDGKYTRTEEEIIRRRLEDLGYLS